MLLIAALSVLLLSADLYSDIFTQVDSTPPQITVWYGERQSFGQAGLPQRWVNVLGNISDGESYINHVDYHLNGLRSVRLRLGPDHRRLNASGDFNIEIDPAALHEGENSLLIDATNVRNLTASVTVTLVYHRQPLPLPYTIDWANVANAQDVLQIVDGKWAWDAAGIRPVEPGYDRMLAVGDQSWTDYQVTVPVTFNGYDPAAFKDRNGGMHAGISIDMRWIGHSDSPVRCAQPHCGWDPSGSFNKYFIMPDGNNFLALKTQEKESGFVSVPVKFEMGHTYIFKASVQTTPGGNLYRFKVWEPSARAEPAGWMFERTAAPGSPPQGDPDHGAIALVAHHTGVTFGNIRVEPLPPAP